MRPEQLSCFQPFFSATVDPARTFHHLSDLLVLQSPWLRSVWICYGQSPGSHSWENCRTARKGCEQICRTDTYMIRKIKSQCWDCAVKSLLAQGLRRNQQNWKVKIFYTLLGMKFWYARKGGRKHINVKWCSISRVIDDFFKNLISKYASSNTSNEEGQDTLRTVWGSKPHLSLRPMGEPRGSLPWGGQSRVPRNRYLEQEWRIQ